MAAAGDFFVTVSCVIRGYNLRQVQIALSGTVPEVYIAIMQYPGYRLAEISGFCRTQSRPKIDFQSVWGKMLQVCELWIFEFLEFLQ